jgi:hypothetical protein
MIFFGFFSEHEIKVCRLIEHLILVTNLLVLITQGYKDDHPQSGSTQYVPTLVILIFFGTCILLMCGMMLLTRMAISIKSRKRDVKKGGIKAGN